MCCYTTLKIDSLVGPCEECPEDVCRSCCITGSPTTKPGEPASLELRKHIYNNNHWLRAAAARGATSIFRDYRTPWQVNLREHSFHPHHALINRIPSSLSVPTLGCSHILSNAHKTGNVLAPASTPPNPAPHQPHHMLSLLPLSYDKNRII